MHWKADEHEQAVKHWKEVEPMGEAALAMAGWEFYRTRCPPLLMYGASQGEAAKSGYSKITLGTSKIKDSNVVKFLCRCKTGGYSNGILLKKRHQSKILWGGISVKGHRGVKCSSYTEEGWKRGRHQCRQKHQWLQKVQRLNTRRDNKAILIALCIWWGGGSNWMLKLKQVRLAHLWFSDDIVTR